MMRLYDYLPSGNGYKVRLLLTQLGIAFERIELDVVQGATRTEGFLAKNPNGRIPLLETDENLLLAESNAILFYLAEGTPFLPDGRGHRCCSGCSSNSTATSQTSRPSVTGCNTSP